jgi:hypothetical protein
MTTNDAQAGIPVFYSNGHKFVPQHTLPDSVKIDGHHVNFGVSFDQFEIMWIPMWNYGATEYALISDDKENAYILDEEDLAYLQEEYGIDTEKNPAIPFWDRIGGKIIWGVVIILFCIWSFRKKGKGDDEEEEGYESDNNSPTEE